MLRLKEPHALSMICVPAREGPETLFRTVFRAKLAKKVQSFLNLQGKSEERSLRGVISPPPSSPTPETPPPNPPNHPGCHKY